MIQLDLTKDERNILLRSLDEYLGELRMEIRDTEKREFKEGLKKEEAVLNRVVSQLRTNGNA